MVFVINNDNNNNNNINIVIDSNKGESKDSIEHSDGNFFKKTSTTKSKQPPNHNQCKSGMSNEKVTSFLRQWCQENFQTSYKRKKCHQKFKFSNQSGNGNQWHQACTWRTQDFQWNLKLSQCKFSHEVAGSCLQWVCWYEKAACVAHDLQESYDP